MAFLHDDVLDDGLQVLSDSANRLDICSAEPATYAEATTTYTLGNKSAPTVAAPSARSPSGREVVVAAIADGLCTADGDAAYWALVDTAGSRLLAAGALSNPQTVTNTNPFTTAEFAVGIPGPA